MEERFKTQNDKGVSVYKPRVVLVGISVLQIFMFYIPQQKQQAVYKLRQLFPL